MATGQRGCGARERGARKRIIYAMLRNNCAPRHFQKRSQNLRIFYHDAAQCYWYKINKNMKFLKKTLFITEGVVLNEFEAYDVDVNEDMENLKKIYKYRLHY